MKPILSLGLFVGIAAVTSLPAQAIVKSNGLFTDGAVLQQGQKIPIFGSADDGETVTVRFGRQTAKTTAQGGKWRVDLKPVKAGGPYTLTIAGPSNTVTVQNVLVGEVYLCSGQSNMSFTLNQAATGPQAIAAANDPMLREYHVPNIVSATPKNDVKGAWQTSTPQTAGGFSAVAYFFGRDLRKALNVPVGLVVSEWGGTAVPLAGLWQYHWGANLPADQAPSLSGINSNSPTVLYNAMIAPLIPYGLKGAIWYQGESNSGDPVDYHTLLPAMIGDWRTRWGEGDFPFLLVQLAPFMDIVQTPQDPYWALLREAQRQVTLNVPNTGMAVITDAGDSGNIHPIRKEPVGQRLALAARALVYHQKVEYTGPVYQSMTVDGSQAILRFTHADGLHTVAVLDGNGKEVAPAGTLTGFAVAGANRKYVNASAVIAGDTIVVSAPAVAQPAAVRYGWANYPLVNLYNSAGLPASPFQTDPFPQKK